MEMEALKPSKVIFMTDVPDNILDRRVIRHHFSSYGTVRRVSIDKESACCSVCFTSNEAAQKAFLEGTTIDNYKLKIMLGTSNGPSLNQKTEPLRDTHTYDDLDMNYLDDDNDVFKLELTVDDTRSEKDLFKMKKKIIRKLHKEKSASLKEPVRRVKKNSTSGDQVKTVKRTAVKGSKLLNKTSATSMTSEELSKVMTLKKKYEILDLRDKLYREKLKATKLNVNVGTCPDMCPEKERIMRAYRKLWASYELRPGINRLVPELAVKEYSRSCANQEEPLPHELRPEPVLNMTMNYLVLNIMPTIEQPDVNVSQWYDFLWDRLRGIRKDVVQQQLCSVNTAHIIEQCARFHILCFDRLCGEDASIFDERINTENLNNCLQSLIHMYDDLHAQGLECPNEPEFRAYEILVKLNRGDIIWEFQQLSPHLQTAPAILFALHVFSAFNNNLYSQFFKLVKQTTYLNACLLQRYFSIVRSKALQSVISTFCRPQDQSFKIPSSYLKDILKFDNDNDVLDFCSAHGMLLTEDGDLSIGKYDFSIPTNVSSCLATSLNMIKTKRLQLPITIAGAAGVPQDIDHKVHSSFDVDGNLNKLAANALDQITKLKEDFGYVVENVPTVEINENILTEYEKLEDSKKSYNEKKSKIETSVFVRLGASVQDTNTSSEIPKTNPFQKDISKVNPFQKVFRTNDNTSGDKLFVESNLSEQSNVDSNIFKKNDLDSNLFKKPLAPKLVSNTSDNSNAFPKGPSNIFKTPSLNSNIFEPPPEPTPKSDTSVPKTTGGSTLFSKSITSDSNIFQKTTAHANTFVKESISNDLFKKSGTNSFINSSSSLASHTYQKEGIASNSGVFTKTTLSSHLPDNFFGKKIPHASVNVPSTNVFGRSSLDVKTLFNRPSSFSEFMKPSNASGAGSKTEENCQNTNFKFLEKVSELKETSHPNSSGKNSGFEKSFELFVQASEQKTRKRAADEEKEEDRQQEIEALLREKENQRLFELERNQQNELEMIKHREKELEIKRQHELEVKRQQAIQIQKQKELEEKKQKELEEHRKTELELERLRQIELEKQKEWEMKVKQDIISKKVEYDFQIAMNKLAKAQRKKTREHELMMIRLRKERELRKLRKIVKKKIKFIHAKKCAKKWKERVKKLKINKLEFPQVALACIENHTAVWGSVKHIRNHAPYQMTDRYETIKQLNKEPHPLSDNVYLGKELMQILKQNMVRPRFIKPNCQSSTPLVWKVSFHLPHLPLDYQPVETQLSQFLRKFCYDNKHLLGECECLKVNGLTLYTSYHLFDDNDTKTSGLHDSDLYVFIMSELWETLEESCARFQANIDVLKSDAEVLVLIYRSSYTEHEIINYFNTIDINVVKWNSATDISQSITSLFSFHFSKQQPSLCYENLYDFLSDEMEAVFLQVKLNLDIVVCTDEIAARLRNPNYFINIYNTLVSKLYLITDQISLAPQFYTVLFKDNVSTVINNSPHQLESVVSQLTLPNFKIWPVLKTAKLKKLLKHFCAVIDKSERNELFTIVMRSLNPPKDNLENHLSRVNWGDILLPCFLWNIKANSSHMSNAFIFYNKDDVKSKFHSHWWVNMP